jgi:8-oxo-dGTP diphosphatase
VLGIGALIFDENRSILLVERGREPLKGLWSLPGGGLETGETLLQGVCREVLEETGLIVQPLHMVEVFERIMLDPEGRTEYHYVLVDYICHIIGGTLLAGDDVASARWFNEHELETLELTEGSLGVIRKAYEIHYAAL